MNKYTYMAIAGFIIWLIGTWHGGWQETPQSVFERCTDILGLYLTVWGVLGDILKNLTFQKNTNISAETVNVVCKNPDRSSNPCPLQIII